MWFLCLFVFFFLSRFLVVLTMKGGRGKGLMINASELEKEKSKGGDVLVSQFKGLGFKGKEMDHDDGCKNPYAKGELCVYGKPLIKKKINQGLFCKVMTKVWSWKEAVKITPVEGGCYHMQFQNIYDLSKFWEESP